MTALPIQASGKGSGTDRPVPVADIATANYAHHSMLSGHVRPLHSVRKYWFPSPPQPVPGQMLQSPGQPPVESEQARPATAGYSGSGVQKRYPEWLVAHRPHHLTSPPVPVTIRPGFACRGQPHATDWPQSPGYHFPAR